MAFNSFSANAFANNFMTGFAFVDQIKSGKRREALLNQRLKEEREERSFQRRRTLEGDKNVRTDRGFRLEDRERLEEERALREKGAKAALNPDTTNAQLLELVPHSPASATELKRRIGVERFEQAIADAQTIPTAGFAGQTTLSQGLAGAPAEQGVAPSATPSGAPQAAAAETGGFNLAPDRGESSLQVISEEQATSFSESFQNKSFLGKAAEVISGQFSQTARAAGDVLGAVGNLPKRAFGAIVGEDTDAIKQNIGQEFTGELLVRAADFTDPEEFAAMEAAGDNEGRREGARRNRQIMADMERRADSPNAMRIGAYVGAGDFSSLGVQDRRAQSSEKLRREAIIAQNKVIKTAENFLDPTKESILDNLAESNPRAAASAYLELRATLDGVDPLLAQRMDRQMVPVLDEALTGISEALATLDPGTQQAKRMLRSLENLRESRNVIARRQPAVADTVGIRAQGLKIGDHERANDVVNEIFNPDRVVAESHTPQELSTAVTIVSRITASTRRLNKKQISAIAILAEERYIDKPTALSVIMTGQWPPGKNPKAIKELQKTDNEVWALHEDGTVSLLPSSNAGKRPDRTVNDKNIGWIVQGAKTTGISESQEQQAIGLFNENAGWIRKYYNMENQESMMAAGRAIGQSIWLSSKNKAKKDDSNWPWVSGKNAPSPEEVFLSITIRSALSAEFGVKPVPVPVGIVGSDLDTSPVRAAIAEGKHDDIDPSFAETMTAEDLRYVFFVLNATPEQIAEANRLNQLN